MLWALGGGCSLFRGPVHISVRSDAGGIWTLEGAMVRAMKVTSTRTGGAFLIGVLKHWLQLLYQRLCGY